MTTDRPDRDSDQVHGDADKALQRSVDKAVPAKEKLAGNFDDNPLSRQLRDAAERTGSEAGPSVRGKR